MPYFALKIWRYAESPYLCNVFLDQRKNLRDFHFMHII